MMNAKELMIGDWVLHDGVPKKVDVIWYNGTVSLCEPSRTWGSVYADRFNTEEVEGIPLTAEILEKNGFSWGHTASEEDFCGATGCGYPEKGWCFDEGAGEIKIIFPNGTDGGLIRLDDQSFDKHLELVFAKPIMLHELQHCLKIVGIDKEIII